MAVALAATADAPDVEHARWPYRFELLSLDRLFVDEVYQRPLTNFLRKIVESYDPAMIGCLIVSERARNRFAVIDGQTRLEGMRQMGEKIAPCLIYEGLSRKDEARLFARFQTERRGMATYLRFRAALVSGDPEAAAISALVRKAGFKVAGDGDEKGITAIAALESLYRRDPDLLLRVLGVVREAWPAPSEDHSRGIPARTKDARTRGEILKGIGRLMAAQKGKLDDERLIARMSEITPAQLQLRANALREGTGSSGSWDRFVADALLGIYAKSTRKGI